MASGVVVIERETIWKAHTTLAIVQILYGGYHIISSVALNAGMNQIIFFVYRDLIALSLLALVAYFRDNRIRLPINSSILISFFFLGLTGVFGNQLLFLMGLGYTNPTYAAVVQPAIPVFTFVGGTTVYVTGAILMVLFKGPVTFGNGVTELLHREVGNDLLAGAQPEPAGWFISGLLGIGLTKFHIGMLCLIGNCFCMVVHLSLQLLSFFIALLLLKYPTSLSVTAYSYFFGAMLMVIVGISATDGNTVWTLTRSELATVLYVVSFASAVNYGATTWSKNILGAALVALYIPLQPFASVLLSKIFLGDVIYLGRSHNVPNGVNDLEMFKTNFNVENQDKVPVVADATEEITG
ncbi:hypothetical protein MKX01_003855 [Papaver californicum]|nr:hypothetical protein MKX01_003855 [Papaver californicum]